MMDDASWQHIEVIARGANRMCVVDPHDPAFCIKLDLHQNQAKAGWSNNLRRFFARVLPDNSFAHQELRQFTCLKKSAGPDIGQHFATIDGLVDTPMGTGLRCQRIIGVDGSTAHPIHYYFDHAQAPDLEVLIDALDRFGDFLIKNDIPLFDLNSGNLLVRKTEHAFQIVCVDIKSLGKTKELIPFALWFKSLRRKKLRRRLNRLKAMIAERKLPIS